MQIDVYANTIFKKASFISQKSSCFIEVEVDGSVSFTKQEWGNKIIIKMRKCFSKNDENILIEQNKIIKSLKVAYHEEDNNSTWLVVDCFQKSKSEISLLDNGNLQIEISLKEIFKNDYPVPQELHERLKIPENDLIKIEDLSFLKVRYFGFDEKIHFGEIIVNKKVAKEVIEIFEELYKIQFPINEISLISKYNNSDSLSMENNNTSAFNYRKITGGKILSMHSLGLAIDINPIENPYIKGDSIFPKKAKINRKNSKGVILKNSECYKIFISRGWKWGGDWKSLKDYQHFEKKL